MARKSKEEKVEKVENILRVPLDEIIGSRFGRYSKYIIQDRALPDIRDGLKPVQRRILFSMNEEGNRFDKAYRKSAKGVGAVMGNYHPHGDSSLYEAMVRMSQDWKMRYPLIDMHGNNGSIDGDGAAAMRYTEARLDKLASQVLNDIDKNTVDMVLNFDDTAKEPTVLPNMFPALLANGVSGISAGYATSIPPHNMTELIDATLLLIDKPKSTVDDLMKHVVAPDFPGGGIIQGVDEIKRAYETGKGKIVIRSQVEVEKLRGGKEQIIIHELPYDVNKATLVKKIDTLRAEKKVDGIAVVRDESNRDGIRVVIELKKDVDANVVLNYLYKNTDLQTNYNFNMVAIDKGAPKLVGLKEILEAFIGHREDVITRRSNFLLEKAKKRLHIVEGFVKLMDVLEDVIVIVRKSKNKAEAKKAIEKKFKFTELQSEAIVSLQLYRLSNADVSEFLKELKELEKEIKYLEGILSSKAKLKTLMKKELTEFVKEFGDARRSVVQKEVEEIKVDLAAVIPEEDVFVSVSRDGYIKRATPRSVSSSGGIDEVGVKDGDEIVLLSEAKTTQIVLAFTSLGNYVYLPIHTLGDVKWKDTGDHISTYAQLNGGETIVSAYLIDDAEGEIYVTAIKDNGLIKRTLLKEFEVQRFGKSYTAIKVKADEKVVGTWLTTGGGRIVITTKLGYGIHFGEDEVAPKGIKTEGMKGIDLREGDEVVFADVLKFKKDVTALEETIGGISEYPRGRKGNKVKPPKKRVSRAKK